MPFFVTVRICSMDRKSYKSTVACTPWITKNRIEWKPYFFFAFIVVVVAIFFYHLFFLFASTNWFNCIQFTKNVDTNTEPSKAKSRSPLNIVCPVMGNIISFNEFCRFKCGQIRTPLSIWTIYLDHAWWCVYIVYVN